MGFYDRLIFTYVYIYIQVYENNLISKVDKYPSTYDKDYLFTCKTMLQLFYFAECKQFKYNFLSNPTNPVK